jgi:micrococcal nuclease
MSSEFERPIQMAIAEAKLGNRPKARVILGGVVRREPGNARAWYLLSQVADTPAQAVDCLKRVLEIEPDNLQAMDRLDRYHYDQEAIKPKKSFGGVLLWVALAMVVCVGVPLCLLVAIAGYSYLAAPTRRLAPVDKKATIDQALAGTLAKIPTYTTAPTHTATATPSPTATATRTSTPTLFPTVTPITAEPVNASGVQPAAQGGASVCVPRNNQVEPGIVTRVIDGDTIEAFVDGRMVTIRYIGIDSPEMVYPGMGVQYFGPEAAEKNRQLVEGKYVFLWKDVSETDPYDRLLRYVMVGDLYGLFVNYELVKQGYASASTYPPDVACAENFLAAQREAEAAGIGLWGPRPVP